MLAHLRFKAILLGLLAGFVASILWRLLAVLILAWLRGGLFDAFDPAFVVLSLLGAAGSMVVCGWVAARLAKENEMQNSGAVGVLVVLLGAAVFVPGEYGQYPLWYNALIFLLTVPMSILGGALQRRQGGRE